MNEVDHITNSSLQVARGITEYGILVVIAAIFLVVTLITIIMFLRWFLKVINKLMNDFTKDLSELLQLTRDQNDKLDIIKEGLTEESMQRFKSIIKLTLSTAMHECNNLVIRILEENHINDREKTKLKIERYVDSIIKELILRIENFKYNNHKVSDFISDQHIQQICECVESEVYNENGYVQKRVFNNLKLIFDSILLNIMSKA